MTGKRISNLIIGVILGVTVQGCATSDPFLGEEFASILAESELITSPSDVAPGRPTASQGDAAAAAETAVALASGHLAETTIPLAASTPFSVRGAMSPEWVAPERWDLTIDQAIQIALANSSVLRDLGARVVQAPGLTPTVYGPAIRATDATTGIDAALSAFDAQLNGDLFFEDNDRILNSAFVGGGENFFEQDLSRFRSSLSKQTATGTSFALRHNVEGDLNNAEQNLIEGRAWTWNIEGEVRQPLMQGRGTLFNRVAGPNATPGVFNGVLIARLRTDISVAEIQVALRDYLSDVENAYWDLYYSYVDLDVKTQARDRSLSTYRLLEARAREGLPNAERDKVAQAKEQYFRFEQDVQNALGGSLVVGTRVFNGSGGGTFQGSGGVYANERRLRMIMGLPINDGRLIRAASDPPQAPATYDWNDVVANALARRTELRRQQLIVEQRQLELTASRNFTMPRLDAVGTYRYRALGDRLYYSQIDVNGDDVATGTHEWLLGLSLAYPVGLRRAYAGVRNAQLRLSRERELLREVERQVVFGVSNAIAECDRAYEVLRVATNRAEAAKEQYDILFPEAQALVRQFDFNALLDSERRLAEAENNANRAAIQYALATKNLNFEMGTLLEYFNIHLVDGQWPRRDVPHSSRKQVFFESADESSSIIDPPSATEGDPQLPETGTANPSPTLASPPQPLAEPQIQTGPTDTGAENDIGGEDQLREVVPTPPPTPQGSPIELTPATAP